MKRISSLGRTSFLSISGFILAVGSIGGCKPRSYNSGGGTLSRSPNLPQLKFEDYGKAVTLGGEALSLVQKLSTRGNYLAGYDCQAKVEFDAAQNRAFVEILDASGSKSLAVADVPIILSKEFYAKKYTLQSGQIDTSQLRQNEGARFFFMEPTEGRPTALMVALRERWDAAREANELAEVEFVETKDGSFALQSAKVMSPDAISCTIEKVPEASLTPRYRSEMLKRIRADIAFERVGEILPGCKVGSSVDANRKEQFKIALSAGGTPFSEEREDLKGEGGVPIQEEFNQGLNIFAAPNSAYITVDANRSPAKVIAVDWRRAIQSPSGQKLIDYSCGTFSGGGDELSLFPDHRATLKPELKIVDLSQPQSR